MSSNFPRPSKNNSKTVTAGDSRTETTNTNRDKPWSAPTGGTTASSAATAAAAGGSHKGELCKTSCSENSISRRPTDKDAKERPSGVVSVKSWNCREAHDEAADKLSTGIIEKELVTEMERISLAAESPDDFEVNSNLLRARDSLEDLLKNEQGSSKNTVRPNTSRQSRDNKSFPESHKSTPDLGESRRPTSVAKVLAWDPFDKVNRKSKDNKRKKLNKKLDSPRFVSSYLEPAIKNNNIDHRTGDEVVSDTGAEDPADAFDYVYEYKFQPKNTKSVVFTNEVMVVYFNGETVISEAKEPLKRELDQQVRNKEMRKGHLLKVQENYNVCLF